MLKAHMKPWFENAYLITVTIEGKLASLQETQQKIKSDNVGPMTEQLVKEMKQAETKCTTKVEVI